MEISVRKSNLLTFIFLCAAMIGAMSFSKFINSVNSDNNVDYAININKNALALNIAAEFINNTIETKTEDSTNSNEIPETVTDITESETYSSIESYETEYEETTPDETELIAENTTLPPKETTSLTTVSQTPSLDIPAPISSADALFIGDSRTVGIKEYSGISDADYFCDVGMNVFKVQEKSLSVGEIGKTTLAGLLSAKKYNKIYIMLGINEIGYNLQSIINKYGELINLIKNIQPDSYIFVQANLHVAKKRSDSDAIINNTAINRLNTELSKFADNSTIFYIDANILFDDERGDLRADKTSDNVHLYAKYYAEWGNWIFTESAKYINS